MVAARMERADRTHMKVEVDVLQKGSDPTEFDLALAQSIGACPDCRLKVEQIQLGSWVLFFMPIFVEKNWIGFQGAGFPTGQGVVP